MICNFVFIYTYLKIPNRLDILGFFKYFFKEGKKNGVKYDVMKASYPPCRAPAHLAHTSVCI